MIVSMKFSVAVHIMLMIDAFPEAKITSEVLAESTGCNPVIIRNIFGKLRKAGLLKTKSGKGKTEIARDDESISLWDIYLAVESDEFFRVHQNTSETCPVGSNIHSLLEPHIKGVTDAMKNYLSGVTLSDMKNNLYSCASSSGSPLSL